MNLNVHTKFSGFSPAYETRQFTATAARRIQFGAPSDAVIWVSVGKGETGFYANCRINSSKAQFFAESSSDSPKAAVTEVEEKINNQLTAWKKRRFDEGADEKIRFA